MTFIYRFSSVATELNR